MAFMVLCLCCKPQTELSSSIAAMGRIPGNLIHFTNVYKLQFQILLLEKVTQRTKTPGFMSLMLMRFVVKT